MTENFIKLVSEQGNHFEVPCDVPQSSDGYHTFKELYDHRCTLFVALIAICHSNGIDLKAWKSRQQSDGTVWNGYFIAGTENPNISYHLPNKYWDLIHNALEVEKAPKWDGHTSSDVVERLQEWTKNANRYLAELD